MVAGIDKIFATIGAIGGVVGGLWRGGLLLRITFIPVVVVVIVLHFEVMAWSDRNDVCWHLVA